MMKLTVRRAAILATMATAAVAGAAYAQQRGSDGTHTRAEAQARATQLFGRLDANDDGKLDPADRTARRNMLFDRLDADKNGALSREEFAARPPRPDSEARGDGERGRGGPQHRMGGRGHDGQTGGPMAMPGKADADKSGSVSQAEFVAAALRRFDRADANKDGQVTREERQAARAAVRSQWQNRMGSKPASAN